MAYAGHRKCLFRDLDVINFSRILYLAPLRGLFRPCRAPDLEAALEWAVVNFSWDNPQIIMTSIEREGEIFAMKNSCSVGYNFEKLKEILAFKTNSYRARGEGVKTLKLQNRVLSEEIQYSK